MVMPDRYKKIADILVNARRERGKTLAEASAGTRIMVSYLEALEAGDPARLPSSAYFMLFARSYAEYLKIDPAVIAQAEENEIAADEMAAPPPGEPEKPPPVQITPFEFEKEPPKAGRRLITGVVVVVILVLAVTAYKKFIAKTTAPTPVRDTTQVAVQQPAATIDSTAMTTTETPPPPAPTKLALVMKTNQEVWARIICDKDTVLSDLLAPGEEYRWEADSLYLLTLGISSAVEFTLNGIKLAPLSERPSMVSNARIDWDTYRGILPADTNSAVMPTRDSSSAPPPPDSSAKNSTGADVGGDSEAVFASQLRRETPHGH
jgi:cytoskeletal protein RodZ